LAIIDFANRDITAKVTYFGPPGAGVSTNVRRLHALLAGARMSGLRHFGTGSDDELTWCFDYAPNEGGQITRFDLRVRVFSLQAGREWEAHRDEVLAGTDAVVFVADARAEKAAANQSAMLELEYSLARQGADLAAIPVVIQVNHSDAATARPSHRVVRNINPYGFPVIPSVARDGKGVLATHNEAIGATLSRLRDNLAGDGVILTLTAVSRAERERDEAIIRRHLAAIDREAPRRERGGMRAVNYPPPTPDFHVREIPMRDHRLIEVIRAELKGRRIWIDFLAESRADEPVTRRWTVVVDTSGEAAPESEPDAVEETQAPAPAAWATTGNEPPHPSLWYGIAGLVGGMISGVLLGYLVFV
jgi:hypothetical protein